MSNYPYEKSPAFFRVIAAEQFFEAEAAEDASLLTLDRGHDVDATLDSILNEAALTKSLVS